MNKDTIKVINLEEEIKKEKEKGSFEAREVI